MPHPTETQPQESDLIAERLREILANPTQLEQFVDGLIGSGWTLENLDPRTSAVRANSVDPKEQLSAYLRSVSGDEEEVNRLATGFAVSGFTSSQFDFIKPKTQETSTEDGGINSEESGHEKSLRELCDKFQEIGTDWEKASLFASGFIKIGGSIDLIYPEDVVSGQGGVEPIRMVSSLKLCQLSEKHRKQWAEKFLEQGWTAKNIDNLIEREKKTRVAEEDSEERLDPSSEEMGTPKERLEKTLMEMRFGDFEGENNKKWEDLYQTLDLLILHNQGEVGERAQRLLSQFLMLQNIMDDFYKRRQQGSAPRMLKVVSASLISLFNEMYPTQEAEVTCLAKQAELDSHMELFNDVLAKYGYEFRSHMFKEYEIDPLKKGKYRYITQFDKDIMEYPTKYGEVVCEVHSWIVWDKQKDEIAEKAEVDVTDKSEEELASTVTDSSNEQFQKQKSGWQEKLEEYKISKDAKSQTTGMLTCLEYFDSDERWIDMLDKINDLAKHENAHIRYYARDALTYLAAANVELAYVRREDSFIKGYPTRLGHSLGSLAGYVGMRLKHLSEVIKEQTDSDFDVTKSIREFGEICAHQWRANRLHFYMPALGDQFDSHYMKYAVGVPKKTDNTITRIVHWAVIRGDKVVDPAPVQLNDLEEY
ncbi:MAG TPA: hypothetical protein VEC13_02020 [Candidatus Paceibacterota bacterium]|nr:hypothetical protein [Candidatus Paceibacterota bacterium]